MLLYTAQVFDCKCKYVMTSIAAVSLKFRNTLAPDDTTV